MPLEPPDQQYWRAAVGYVELGMFQEANDQLENIYPFNRAAVLLDMRNRDRNGFIRLETEISHGRVSWQSH
jgi:hypothetical protein